MSVLNMSSSRNLPEADLEQLAQLAVSLSRRLTRLLPEDMAAAIAEALAEVAAAIRVDTCQLLEFAECGAVARAHTAGTRRRDEPDGLARMPGGLVPGLALDIRGESAWTLPGRTDVAGPVHPGGAGVARRAGGCARW